MCAFCSLGRPFGFEEKQTVIGFPWGSHIKTPEEATAFARTKLPQSHHKVAKQTVRTAEISLLIIGHLLPAISELRHQVAPERDQVENNANESKDQHNPRCQLFLLMRVPQILRVGEAFRPIILTPCSCDML